MPTWHAAVLAPLLLLPPPAGSGAAIPARHGSPELRAALTARSPRGRRPRWVRLLLSVPAGWHIGAERPGRVGLPTRVTWALPAGWRLAEVRWPAPRPDVVGRDTSFVYTARAVAIDAALAAPPGTPDGRVRVTVSYGLCRDVCIPGRATAALAP